MVCSRGFTLLELMLVLALCAGFVAAVYECALLGLRTVRASSDRADIRQQLTTALDLLAREASAANHVDQAQDQRFQFDSDIDGDGNDEDNINYVVQNGDLVRSYGSATVTLVRDLASIDFNYVDLNNAAMSTPVASGDRDDIRVVQIAITASKGAESLTLAAASFLRNNN